MRSLIAVATLMISCAVQGNELRIHLPDQTTITLNKAEIEQEFSQTSFTTLLPWFEDNHQFSGILVSQLLEKYDVSDAFAVSFIALNDYSSTTSIEDINKYAPMIAMKMDGKPMKVRHKGPYWLVYNLDEHPNINHANYHSQMVWQIDEIVIHSAQDGNKQ
ncbi:molybdopterin-dependent oxidoreductase [Vibrio sp. LaRot3]|uniref:molybdopterin-dependent oxidoreductase n=1 Tax=Vibrio sp. LaRot3 TaxID=2998829 RepID=UPI0022CDFA29|nr:molybdopterin-dependent oxidoreductase [Vibrio sp. LaRot3]MDA0148942.1 molybdopterin-dependent oxidoreductase [Vibrio sp. LaRot3]